MHTTTTHLLCYMTHFFVVCLNCPGMEYHHKTSALSYIYMIWLCAQTACTPNCYVMLNSWLPLKLIIVHKKNYTKDTFLTFLILTQLNEACDGWNMHIILQEKNKKGFSSLGMMLRFCKSERAVGKWIFLSFWHFL